MAVADTELFGIYPAVFGGLTLTHVTNVEPAHEVQKMVARAGGATDPGKVVEISREPTVSLTGHNLGAILTAVSATLGLPVTTSWKAQYQHKADGGTFTGNGANVTLSGTKGMLLIDSVSAQQDEKDPLGVMLKFYALWDGSTVDGNGDPLPISVATGQNLSGSPAVGAIYKLGKVVVEGTALGGLQSAKATFGVGYSVTRAGGEKAARIGTIDKRDPVLEAEAHNLAIVAALGHGGSQASSGMTIYFRQIGYADGATQHVSVSLGAGLYEVTPMGTDAEGKAKSKITLTGTGTVSIGIGVAIP